MQKYAWIFLLLSLMYTTTEAKRLRWPEVRNKKLIAFDWNCSRTELFPKKALRKIVQRAIPPEDKGLPGTGDRAFTAKLLSEGSAIYFVPLTCGATGNCTWRLYLIDPVIDLGEVSGQYIYVYKSSKGWPTIITYTHMSASAGILATFLFRNHQYKWIGDEYSIDYEWPSGNRMPKFLEKAKKMCKEYGY